MIVDSSAVVSILFDEPDREVLLGHLADAAEVGIGVPTLVETGIVLSARLGPAGASLLGRFVTEAGLRPIAVTDAHWPVAVGAYLRYGKGRHPAALNFGDCLTYAVAAVSGRPLLCVGDDFPRTDLALVT
ncbi:type II toxin-antitoxin system VapC family toxin [Jiangella asiatica]|uniref:Ribonuclease VapC n=1 Tax=Jiangella asiatica TaxID=2530372 RepID=A0A4V2Z2F4_9ACTN|nr:type II toxin-antitoxin system VapC family toxin [Jiangella asiatica]TDE08598.1 type II toxin-antitoxin system VapC family toxin [Jiangella asiatica]